METTETFADLHCLPLQDQEGVVTGDQLPRLHRYIPIWRVIQEHGYTRLYRAFAFGSFTEALRFTERIGRIAQMEVHFPVLLTEWGQVQVWWWTAELKGILRNDFIMAAKTDHEYLDMVHGSVIAGRMTAYSDPLPHPLSPE